MLTEKQLKIFEPLTRNIFKECTVKEIKAASGEKSNNALALAFKKFKEEDLIKERKVGRTRVYAINAENDMVFNYLQLINMKKLPKSALRALEKIKNDAEKYTPFFSIAVFGSYAAGKQTKDSDLDVAIFIESEEKRKMLETALKSSELKTILEIHGQVITKDEFLEMLKADYENLGKEIARKHLIIHNLPPFYSLLKKGIKNGFKY